LDQNIFRSQKYLTSNIHDVRGNGRRFWWKAAVMTVQFTWKQ